MAWWKELKSERQEGEGRLKNDLNIKSAGSSEIKELIADVEDLVARISDVNEPGVVRVRGKVQRAVDATKQSLAEGDEAIGHQVRDMEGSYDVTPSASALSGLDADTEREEQLNVEILRQHVRARAAEDPDAAAFGWVAHVGAALRRARDARGLTQTVLSDGTKITQGYLSSLETGKLVRGPTVDVLYRYAAALGCDCEITLRDSQTDDVVTTVRSRPVENAIAAAIPDGVYAEFDKTR